MKSCINYITLLSTSNITLMKPLRSKSLPIRQIMVWITLTKTFPKLTPVQTCWYVKDFLFSLHFFYSDGYMHSFRVTLAENYCKRSWLILNCWRLPKYNLHIFFFQSVCTVWMQCCIADGSRRLWSTEAINRTRTNTQTEGWWFDVCWQKVRICVLY